MNYLLDGAIILIIVLTIYLYYRRGFVKAVLGVGKTLLSFICSAIFGHSLGEILAESYFDSKITDMIYNTLIKQEASVDIDNIPSSLALVAEKCGVDVDSILKGSSTHDWQQNFATQAGTAISSVVSMLLGYVLVFIVAYLVFLIGSFVLGSIVELHVLKTIDRLLGMCLGAMCAIIFVFLFVFLVKVVIYWAVASGDRGAVLEIIEKTYLFRFFSKL